MRHSFLIGFLFVIGCVSGAALAQTSGPVRLQSIPDQPLAPGGSAVTIDLRNYFGLSGVDAEAFLVQFDTTYGRFNVELQPTAAPRQVANFLSYVDGEAYANSVVHRSTSFDGGGTSIVQGGGYRNPPALAEIPRFAPVPLESSLSHARGTLAAARGDQPGSTTSEWFFNVRDNSVVLAPGNEGGFTVFGRVLGAGMTVVDQIAALPRIGASPGLAEVPVRNYFDGPLVAENFVGVNWIQSATVFPTGGGVSAIDLFVENTAPTVVAVLLSGSTLTLTPLEAGRAVITARAVDPQGSAAAISFAVTIPNTPPVFATQPASRAMTIAAGSTAVVSAAVTGAASYRWERNGAAIGSGASNVLVLENTTAAQAGAYRLIATNALGETASDPVTLTVVDAAPGTGGRLVNLSILTQAGVGARVLTVGAVVGPFDAPGALPLVVRAVGPTLAEAPFNVPGVLGDPSMTLFAAGGSAVIDTNDDWGGGGAAAAAFAAVGAFALPANSRDSALVLPSPGLGVGGYTVQISGKAGESAGRVLAEIYDASGSNRAAASPRLINVSTLAQIEAGADLTAGFVIGGQTARTVLVRGVGPSLTRLGVSGVMPDPILELFNNDTGQMIGGNDDWAGALEVSATAALVGAFSLGGGTSKDAALLVTLSPGAYSARVSDATGSSGTAIIEVYEVP
jgi:cyclophilin family peptidyl-prolyl cis-trans isomerase